MRVSLALLLPLVACFSVRRASVPPGESAEGDRCFTTCTSRDGTYDEVFACVSACPGAQTADEGCDSVVAAIGPPKIGATATVHVINAKLMPAPDPVGPAQGEVLRGAELMILASSGDWYRVSSQGRSGWVHKANVADVLEATACVEAKHVAPASTGLALVGVVAVVFMIVVAAMVP